jgi:predicted RNA-binding Zn-ribbon protein involved in translation (DUF1610 family)
MLDMKTQDKVLELRTKGKTIPEICSILGIKKGSVGYHLKNLNLSKNNQSSKPSKSKDYWPILKGEEQSIGTYHNNIRGVLKRFIIKNNIIPYMCSECGCDDNWRGKKMSLILDHINGINNDNRLENLRFLCPNCDSIQDTYKGRNKKTMEQ